MNSIYLVTDGAKCGNPDLYGVFSSQQMAQAFIDRQKALKFIFWDGLVIEEYPLDDADDLVSL